MFQCIRNSSLLMVTLHNITKCRGSETLGSQWQLITKFRKSGKSSSKVGKRRHLVDFKKVLIEGGAGGDGSSSFLSLFANEFAGPDGGDGGNGGDVVFEANEHIRSLSHLKSSHVAPRGENGRKKNCYGKNAEHLYLKVPVGTLIRDEDQITLVDLCNHGDRFVAARGGAGGKGNKFFATSTNTAPTIYEEGFPAESREVYAEMRFIAHVGLVGFPNAGKSSLLRALTKAHPKVAPYSFTTQTPQLGVIDYRDYEQVRVADLPGLIKGAHLNKGLGIQFLRHIERCICLLYVLDLSTDDPWAQLDDLRFELEQYKAGLSSRTYAVVANKMDLQMSAANLDIFKSKLAKDVQIFPISAKKKLNIQPLLEHIRQLYDKSTSNEM